MVAMFVPTDLDFLILGCFIVGAFVVHQLGCWLWLRIRATTATRALRHERWYQRLRECGGLEPDERWAPLD